MQWPSLLLPPATALVVYPLIAATLFAFAALALKRASHLGVAVWHTAFISNGMGALCYSVLWFWGGEPVDWDLLWQPALLGLCLFCGMALQFTALEHGDVSVTVPVLGLKVLIVALLTPLMLGESVRIGLWIAAFLSVLGITLLNWRTNEKSARSIWPALLAGGGASCCFGIFDIYVQKWSPLWGAGHLLPLVFGMNALLSGLCWFGFPRPLNSLSRSAWSWLLTGGLLLGMQSIFFVGCVAVYGGATSANIVYSARGLISVLLIWTIGHWFSNQEQSLGVRVLGCRLLGAVIMLAAIVLVILRI
jgi:drug/metabolite transporter (DMT)-like permease